MARALPARPGRNPRVVTSVVGLATRNVAAALGGALILVPGKLLGTAPSPAQTRPPQQPNRGPQPKAPRAYPPGSTANRGPQPKGRFVHSRPARQPNRGLQPKAPRAYPPGSTANRGPQPKGRFAHSRPARQPNRGPQPKAPRANPPGSTANRGPQPKTAPAETNRPPRTRPPGRPTTLPSPPEANPSPHPARPELDGDPWSDRLGGLRYGVFPGALARAAHHDEVAQAQGVAEGLAASARPE